MNDISYEILDLFKKYGSDPEGIQKILENDSRPEVLYALSDVRKNLFDWMELKKCENVLQLDSGYGVLTGLFAERCAHVTVTDRRDENLVVNEQRNSSADNISYIKENDWKKEDHREAYDLVVLESSRPDMDLKAVVKEASQYVKQGGRLVFACENALGLCFLSGAVHDEDESAFTKGELEAAFREAGLETVEFYYPMPEYKRAQTVYSDRYLPGKGDIPHVTAVYDRQRWACIHEDEISDKLVQEKAFGLFANAYLAVASKEQEPFDTIFAKYNRTRKPQFQIRTRILEENGKRYVEKAALTEASGAHIGSMEEKHEKLSKVNPEVHVLEPHFSEDKQAVRFEFLTGKTLAEELGGQIRGKKAPVEAIQAAMEQVFSKAALRPESFYVTPEFLEVFGRNPAEDSQDSASGELEQQLSALSDASYAVSNIDGLFENLMVSGGKLYCLDYEWVFDFPVPAGFVRYRNLVYFYYKYEGLMDYENAADFLKEFGIGEELSGLYAAMEESFQSWVHGDGTQGYMGNYKQRLVTLEELKAQEKELDQARERINQLQEEVEERNIQVKKDQEILRLTNNHVKNLEIMIKDLRHEIDELGKLATYLNGHEAAVYKLRRKLGVQVNKAFPKGTRKRKVLNYCFHTVRHPAKYMKMYATKEGRNLIEGDFKIGEGYLTGGHLSFPQYPGEGKEGKNGWEGPLVSIVIPCYNQIHYTYACLQSILEYTKDVTYEVIIADDVSTDATAEISRFVDGLVICRNQTNQGFLRNCNQAAKAARGKYIMFLNNDTKVTEGWLSSLVKLIESDPSIGMVGSKLVYPDGRLQEAGGILWSDGSGWNYGRLDDPDKAEYNYVKDVDYISGAAILLSVQLWKQIGGFDERFAPAYCEDSDLAFEVRKAGYRVVYQPLSKVIHFEGVSNGTDVNGTGLKRYQVENSKKLREKWADEFKRQSVNDGNPNPFRARERSQGKKVILVVDHYVPTFDKDAGSKTTYQYLKMFLKKGYVVKFLGDNFLHEEPYSTALQQMGIEILYGDDWASGIWDWLKRNKDEIDFAYLNRPHIATKYVDFIKENTNIKVIYYGHDLHFLRLGREYALTGDISIKREADYWKAIELSMMRKAAISYYPSYVEVDAIHKIDPEIPVKAITAYVYDEFLANIQEDFAKREGLLFVGGFAHPPNADAVLWFAQEIFPLIREKLPEINFYVVGSKVTDEIKALEQPGNGIIIKGFVSEEELAELYASCRIVVVPLRYGAGVKGKVVEAIYNGAPIVTTGTGAEGIPEVETILEIEDDPAAFAEKCVSLYNDPARCRSMCHATQDYIRRHFSLEGAWKVIEEDFRDSSEQCSHAEFHVEK